MAAASSTTKNAPVVLADNEGDVLNPAKEKNDMTTLAPIVAIDHKIAQLLARKEKAVEQMLIDYEWMDIPIIRLQDFAIEGRDRDSVLDTMHLVETIWQDPTAARSSLDLKAHDATLCLQDGHWCQKVGETRWAAGTRTPRRIGFKFHGTYKVLARFKGETFLTLESPKKPSRLSIADLEDTAKETNR